MLNEYDIILRLILSAVLGGLIGLERESLNKSAGFRTHVLVSVGSTLIMLISLQISTFTVSADPARLAAQVVSGIGFLGAGTILREGANVRGLTTAASLWVVSGVGLTIGSGFYFEASVATVIIFISLVYLGKVEAHFMGKRAYHRMRLVLDDAVGQVGRIGTVLAEQQVSIKNIEVRPYKDNQVEVDLMIRIPNHKTQDDVITALLAIPKMHQVEGDD